MVLALRDTSLKKAPKSSWRTSTSRGGKEVSQFMPESMSLVRTNVAKEKTGTNSWRHLSLDTGRSIAW